jgi:hypothetical protein
VLEPDDSDAAALVQRILTTDPDLQMPPPGSKKQLTDDERQLLVAWVQSGAAYQPHWAFVPPQHVRPPLVESDWVRTPIDAFVLDRLMAETLTPSREAVPETLLRRITLDLIGLPPTPEEIETFVSDARPDAYRRLVDRLLASPAYGERWGRHWLDVARYGEDLAHSFQPRLYPDGWRYRDWVVNALNADLPYDRFVTEQIAGDLLDGPRRAEQLTATGFFALGPIYYGRATDDELDDRVDTLARGFLGLTVACARCHDHKFDPIPTRDYYALAGVFASTDYREHVVTRTGALDDRATQEPTDRTRDKKAARKPVIHALKEGKPVNLKIRIRGNPATLGEEVSRRFLSILAGDDPPLFQQGSGRLELARAILGKDNPLTARVLVNRVWAHHFGRGIVATVDNFGSLGERPTHPELLDHLAGRFVDGWSIKALHREILLSATYQMSSRHDEKNDKIDPENRLLWRMNRRRLEVEPWRDALIAVAGHLDHAMGGPPRELAAPDNHRRTLYAAVSRHNLDPVLRLFDFPDPNLTSGQRAVTIVPLQQLFVLNSDFMARQAKGLAARVADAERVEERIRRAFVLAYGRPPSRREVELGEKYLASATWEDYAQVLLSANEFAFVD